MSKAKKGRNHRIRTTVFTSNLRDVLSTLQLWVKLYVFLNKSAAGNTGRLPIPMKLTDFRYKNEQAIIPNRPAVPRDSSRLMVVNRADQSIRHMHFSDIHEIFNPGDVLVINNTKVFPARLRGRKEKTEAMVEVFLLRELQPENMLWDVLVEPARKIRIGNKLYFDEDIVAEVVDNTTSRGRTIRFIFDGPNEDLYHMLDRIGTMPLPPYIERKPDDQDKNDYQSVFAKERGAVAAPSAAMHFTPELVQKLQQKGVIIAPVTLHIGWGTFRPVEVEDLTKHRMDSENFYIPEDSTETINTALKSKKNKVVVCGTSAVRAVESSVTAAGFSKPAVGWTDKFIYPPYDFKVTQSMITNFHPAESTLLMLACAFGGHDLVMRAYQEALDQKYRFYTFGDAMIVL
jgi:S-adenosylmethionine:tRNA ribosyltransferase-isomerase